MYVQITKQKSKNRRESNTKNVNIINNNKMNNLASCEYDLFLVIRSADRITVRHYKEHYGHNGHRTEYHIVHDAERQHGIQDFLGLNDLCVSID